MDIFCPNNHLMLSSQACPKCGWRRPVEGAVGTLFWAPIEFNTPIGGVSRSSLTSFVSHDGILVVSTQNNELAGISLEKGNILWRRALPKAQRATSMKLHNDEIYVIVQDTHSLIEGIKGGYIGRLNIGDGELTTIWTTTSHDLTPPLFDDGMIFIRTAESQVLGLTAFSEEPIWERECQSWWPAPLNCFGDYIVYVDGNPMLEATEVMALEKETGSVAWTHTLPTRPSQHLVGDDRYIFVVIYNKKIVILDTKTGQQVKDIKLPRVYSQLVLSGTKLYYTARGSNIGPGGYYQLHVYDSEKFNLKYRKDLGIKVVIPPVIIEDVIYLADYNSNIRAISANDGSDIWSLTTKEEDVILTTLHHADNQLLYGTYLGKVYSVTMYQPQEAQGDVESSLAEGDVVKAAALYALEGNFDQAGQLYVSPIGDIDKAIRLFEEGKHWDLAAKLAFDNNRYSKALEYYRLAGDTRGEADTLLAMGDIEEAARRFNNLGDGVKAAELMEQAGKFSIAARMYRDAGRRADYLRLVTRTRIDTSEVAVLREQGNYEVAANWELQNRQYLEAAKDFREAKNLEKELEAFKLFLDQSDQQADPWVWQRVADLASNLEDHLVAALAWKKLDHWGRAGDEYQKYAEQLAAKVLLNPDGYTTPEHLQVAEYFQLAADAFNEEGIADCESHCNEMVRKFKKLPKVIVLVVQSTIGLREMEWSALTLTIKNIGYGRARNVRFWLDEERFEVQESDLINEFNLATGLTKDQSIHIKPHRDETGGVPLQINWSWNDNDENTIIDGGSISVPVARQREEPQPINITFQDIHGDLVTQKGDNISVSTVIGAAPEQISQLSSAGDGDVDYPEDETPTVLINNKTIQDILGDVITPTGLEINTENLLKKASIETSILPGDGIEDFDELLDLQSQAGIIEKTLKNCVKCDELLEPGANYCASCGAKQPPLKKK